MIFFSFSDSPAARPLPASPVPVRLPFCRTASWSPCGTPCETSRDSRPARRTWTVCRWRCASPSTAPCSSSSRKWPSLSPGSARCRALSGTRPWPESGPSRTAPTNGRRPFRRRRRCCCCLRTANLATVCCTCRNPRPYRPWPATDGRSSRSSYVVVVVVVVVGGCGGSDRDSATEIGRSPPTGTTVTTWYHDAAGWCYRVFFFNFIYFPCSEPFLSSLDRGSQGRERIPFTMTAISKNNRFSKTNLDFTALDVKGRDRFAWKSTDFTNKMQNIDIQQGHHIVYQSQKARTRKWYHNIKFHWSIRS